MRAPDWVVSRLETWGRWVAEQNSGALGYPRANILALQRSTPASTDHVPIDGIQAQRTDAAVRVLLNTSRVQWLAVRCRYAGPPLAARGTGRSGPMLYREIAELMSVTEATAREYCHLGEMVVLEVLDG